MVESMILKYEVALSFENAGPRTLRALLGARGWKPLGVVPHRLIVNHSHS